MILSEKFKNLTFLFWCWLLYWSLLLWVFLLIGYYLIITILFIIDTILNKYNIPFIWSYQFILQNLQLIMIENIGSSNFYIWMWVWFFHHLGWIIANSFWDNLIVFGKWFSFSKEDKDKGNVSIRYMILFYYFFWTMLFSVLFFINNN